MTSRITWLPHTQPCPPHLQSIDGVKMFDRDRHCLHKSKSWQLSGGIDGAVADDHSPTDRPTPEHCSRPASMLTTVLCVSRPHNNAHALHLYIGPLLQTPPAAAACYVYGTYVRWHHLSVQRAPERRDGVKSERTCACTGEDRWALHIAATAHVRGVFQKFVAFDTRARDKQLKPTTFLYIISLIRNAYKPVVLQALNY